jgi:hypothetical protein
MLVSLLHRRHIRFPPGFGMWMLFLAWLAVSAIRLDGADRLPAYLYRASAYVSVPSCTCTCSTPRRSASPPDG